jgi:hypothetical protein
VEEVSPWRLVQMKKDSGMEMREMRGQVQDLTADVQELNRACRVARGGDQYQCRHPPYSRLSCTDLHVTSHMTWRALFNVTHHILNSRALSFSLHDVM